MKGRISEFFWINWISTSHLLLLYTQTSATMIRLSTVNVIIFVFPIFPQMVLASLILGLQMNVYICNCNLVVISWLYGLVCYCYWDCQGIEEISGNFDSSKFNLILWLSRLISGWMTQNLAICCLLPADLARFLWSFRFSGWKIILKTFDISVPHPSVERKATFLLPCLWLWNIVFVCNGCYTRYWLYACSVVCWEKAKFDRFVNFDESSCKSIHRFRLLMNETHQK